MANDDLEERTLEFARKVRKFVKIIRLSIANENDCKQVVGSSGSVGAKETRFWLACMEGNIHANAEEKDSIMKLLRS